MSTQYTTVIGCADCLKPLGEEEWVDAMMRLQWRKVRDIGGRER
jgi:hypothetical protein